MKSDEWGSALDAVLRVWRELDPPRIEPEPPIRDRPELRDRNSPAVELVLTTTTGSRFAIEHTRIQGLPEHLKVETLLDHAFDDVESVAGLNAFFRVEYPLNRVEDRKYRDAAAVLLRSQVPEKFNRRLEADFTIPIEGFNDPLHVFRSDEDSPGLRIFVVEAVQDPSVNEALDESMNRAIQAKTPKLLHYVGTGIGSVLLLELKDRSRSGAGSIYKAFLRARGPASTPMPDEIWIVQGGGNGRRTVRCLWGPQSLMDKVNHPNLLWGPDHEARWELPAF